MKIITTISLACLLASTAQAASLRYNYTIMGDQVPANWQKIASEYGSWINDGNPYNCSNWSPSASSQGKGVVFTQTASDCRQKQERWAQDYIKNNVTNEVIKSGQQYQETREIQSNEDREAVGILENWLPFSPTYTTWVDTNALYGCTAWTPNPSIYTETTNFSQNAMCKTDQERSRQDREQERYTSEIRNVGEAQIEQQTLSDQLVSRPYTIILSPWTNTGDPYACSNWSPSADTVGKGIKFTQNATDCSLDQNRQRYESYRDHKTGANVQVAKPAESRTLINQASTRNQTGTLENWMPIASTYSYWTDVNALDNCSNWSPTADSRTIGGSFSQVALNCTTEQTRTRQDREKEQNSGQIRNKGELVTESQTLYNQTASRTYNLALGSWFNKGTYYGCTNWSPDTSTIAMSQSFTQTATDCSIDQTRTRSDSYVDHRSGNTVDLGSKVETRTMTGQSNFRGAYGTKQTWVAAAPLYTTWSNTNPLYGCTNWSPAGSTKTASSTFTQTATDCKTDQARLRQDREQETTTLAYRNKGTQVTETQTLTGQSVNRSYTVSLGAWGDSGAKYSCSNWSPDPSTVNSGQSFTQTATDCKQDQTRTRAESYVDHKTGSAVAVSVPGESQTLSGQTSTRTATGTKATQDCRWSLSAPKYAWAWVPGGNPMNPGPSLLQVVWNNTIVWNGAASGPVPVTAGGYKYTPSTNMLCREAL